jgi:hypothetical protein
MSFAINSNNKVYPAPAPAPAQAAASIADARENPFTCWDALKIGMAAAGDSIGCIACCTCCACCGRCQSLTASVLNMQTEPGWERCGITCYVQATLGILMPCTLCACGCFCCGLCAPIAKAMVESVDKSGKSGKSGNSGTAPAQAKMTR